MENMFEEEMAVIMAMMIQDSESLTYRTFRNDCYKVMVRHVTSPVVESDASNREPHDGADHVHNCVR